MAGCCGLAAQGPAVELERLQAVLRLRSPSEAVDLGFAMLRRWAGPVLRASALGVVPPVALICGLLHGHPMLAALLLAWLAPIFERIPLFVLSRCLFGAPPDRRTLLNALPGLLFSGALRDLLLLRLSPMRTMLAPVALLEGLTGAPLHRRRADLGRGAWWACLALAACCTLVEIGATVGLLAFVWSFLPDSPLYDPTLIVEQTVPTPGWLGLTTLVAFALGSSLAHHLRAAGGFGLYVARRTAAEGWDIELQLRRLAARTAKAAPLALLVVMMGGAIVGGGATAAAQDEVPAPAPSPDVPSHPDDPAPAVIEPPPRPDDAAWVADAPPLDPPDLPPDAQHAPAVPSEAQSAGDLEAVLAAPEAGGTETVRSYRLREAFDLGWEWPFDWPSDRADDPPTLDLGPLGALLAQALQVLVAIALLLALAAALRLVWSARGRAASPPGTRAIDAETTALPDPTAPAPIDRLGAEALRLLDAGQPEAALALLYRGAVALLVEGGLPIEDSATEGEALRVARRALPPGPLALVQRLTLAWQAVAYAHAAVDSAALRALCNEIGALRSWARTARPEAGT